MPSSREIAGTAVTPSAADANKILRCVNTGKTTVTLAASIPVGTSFGVEAAAGPVEFAAGAGTTSIIGDLFLLRDEAFVMFIGSGTFVVYSQRGPVFTPEQFGARGDGTTDDTAAIQAALNAASATVDAAQGEPQGGGRVRAAARMYRITSTVVVPGNVCFIGEGPRATVLLADSGWNVGTSPYMVRLGSASSGVDRITSNNYLAKMEVNGNAIAGLRGVYSDSISEHAGLRDVRFLNCLRGVIRTEWTGTAGSEGASNHFSIVDVDDLLSVACDDNRIAFDLTSTNPSSKCYLQRITIHNDVANITSKQTTTGIFANRSIQGRDIHIEGCVLGISVGAADSVSLVGVDGDPETDYVVRLQPNMAGKEVFLADIRDGGATVTIRDSANVDTTGDVALWTSGAVFLSGLPLGSIETTAGSQAKADAAQAAAEDTAAAALAAHEAAADPHPGYATTTAVGDVASDVSAVSARVDSAEASLAELWLPPGALVPALGTPEVASLNGYQMALCLNAAESEAVAGSIVVPDGWTSAAVSVVWAPREAGTGNVYWGSVCEARDIGETVGAALVNGVGVLSAASGVDVISEAVLDDDVPVAGGEILSVAVYRLATAPSDTYGADAGILGIRVTKQ